MKKPKPLVKGPPVFGGRYYKGMHEVAAPPHEPDVWICRRLEDFPGGITPTGTAKAPCSLCGRTIVYSLITKTTAPKSCMQCNDIEPDPLDQSVSPISGSGS